MKRLIALLVAVGGAVVLAGLYVPSDAATVGGTSISRRSLDSDLAAIASSRDFTCYLYEDRELTVGTQAPFLGVGSTSAASGVYDTSSVDAWLTSMITQRLAALAVARRGLRLDEADVAAGRRALERRITSVLQQFARSSGAAAPNCGGSGAAVLASVPRWFARAQVRAEADQALLAAHAVHAALSHAGLVAYYDAHRRVFDHDCLRIIVVRARAQAVRAEAALSRGVSFAAEAAAVSLTRRSATDGGKAGCGELAGTFLGPDVASLGVGSVSRPLPGDGLYWVVRVTRRTPRAFGAVRATVLGALLAAGRARAGAELSAELHAAGVTVDPRYGSRTVHGPTLLAPPPPPPPTAQLSTAADQAPLTAATR